MLGIKITESPKRLSRHMMYGINLILLLSFQHLTAQSCADGSYQFSDIVSIFQLNACLTCHTPINGEVGGDLNLNDYNNVVTGGIRGVDGCGPYPDALAFLIGKIDGTLSLAHACGQAMPQGIPYGTSLVPVNEIAAIQAWIDHGAPEFCTCENIPDISTFCVRRRQCNGNTEPNKVKWADVEGALGYEFYGEYGPGNTLTKTRDCTNPNHVPCAGFNVPGNIPNNLPVMVRLRATCANGSWGPWTALTPYTIPNDNCSTCAVPSSLPPPEILAKPESLNTQNEEAEPFLLYPNPVRSLLYIEPPPEKTVFYLELINLYGSIIQKRTLEYKVGLDLTDLNAGVYFLRIRGKHFHSVKKFSKME